MDNRSEAICPNCGTPVQPGTSEFMLCERCRRIPNLLLG